MFVSQCNFDCHHEFKTVEERRSWPKCLEDNFYILVSCTPDVKLLAVGLRPHYLPREFLAAIVLIVYTCGAIHFIVTDLQTRHLNALVIVNGDFTTLTFQRHWLTSAQYMTCNTREDKNLDLMYANINKVYSDSPPGPGLTPPSPSRIAHLSAASQNPGMTASAPSSQHHPLSPSGLCPDQKAVIHLPHPQQP